MRKGSPDTCCTMAPRNADGGACAGIPCRKFITLETRWKLGVGSWELGRSGKVRVRVRVRVKVRVEVRVKVRVRVIANDDDNDHVDDGGEGGVGGEGRKEGTYIWYSSKRKKKRKKKNNYTL